MTPRQEEIYTLVKQHPGLALVDVARAIRLSPETVEYHWHRLERQGRAKRIATGNGRPTLLYTTENPLPRDAKDHLLMGEAASVVEALQLAERPLSETEIASMTLRSRHAAKRLLDRLVQHGLVERRAGLYQLREECQPRHTP